MPENIVDRSYLDILLMGLAPFALLTLMVWVFTPLREGSKFWFFAYILATCIILFVWGVVVIIWGEARGLFNN